MEQLRQPPHGSAAYAAHGEQVIGLGQLLEMLWSRKFLIAICALAFVGLAVIYLAVADKTYSANASLLIEPRFAGITEADNVLAGIGADSAAVESQVMIISSNQLLQKVFRDQNILSDPEFSKPGMVGGIIASLTGNSEPPTEVEIFDQMTKKLEVERAGLTYVIDVGFSSESPEKAARIANAIAYEYLASLTADRSKANSDVTDLLENPIDDLRASVVEAETAIETFKSENGILGLNNGGTLDRAEIESLNQRLLEARERTTLAKDRYQQAASTGTSLRALNSAQSSLNSRTLEELRVLYGQASARLASLQTTYGPSHPLYVSTASEVRQLAVQMQTEANRVLNQLREAYEVEQNNLRSVEAELGRLRDQIELADRQEVQLRQLESRAAASRAVLERFLRRSEETSELQKIQRPEAKIIHTAIPPTKPTWPQPTIILPISLMLGLAIGVFAAIGLGSSAGRRKHEAIHNVGIPDAAISR